MDIIVLGTAKYGENYFNSSNVAPYPGFDYKLLGNWDELNKALPIPAIGIYKGGLSLNCFNFIKIVGMKYDNLSIPYFDFRVISRSNVASSLLINELPTNLKRPLFFTIDNINILNILTRIGVTPPKEWLNIQANSVNEVTMSNLVNETPTPVIASNVTRKSNYLDYIGEHFKKLLTTNISNNEFEDITASLLIALGFDVTKMGYHLSYAAKADGVASFDSKYSLVYDCKNSNEFVLTEDFKRTIDKYAQDEKLKRGDEKIYPVFISRGFANPNNSGYFCFSINSLLYLLYKKLILGNKFNLRPLSIILNSNYDFSKNRIDIEWPS